MLAMDKVFFVLGALFAFLAVALGAFGAHSLQGTFAAGMADVYETGVKYQFYHALGLFAVAFAISRWKDAPVSLAGWLFVVGIVLFSGSLYVLSLTGVRWLGIVTPLGGLAFLAGWVILGIGVLRA